MEIRHFATCGAAVLCAAALRVSAYDVAAGETLTVTDASNSTAAYPDGIDLLDATSVVVFDTSSAPAVSVSGAGTARKASSADWTMSADMSGMTGTWELSGGGVVSFSGDGAFCAKNRGTVSVSNGTTLRFTAVGSRLRSAQLRISGRGCGDCGALDFRNAKIDSENPGYDANQLTYLALDGDARITIAANCTMYGGGELDLNGHDLEIRGAGTFCQAAVLKGEGDVTFTAEKRWLVYDMAQNATVTPSKTSGFRLTGDVQLHYGRAPVQPDRILYLSGTTNQIYYQNYWGFCGHDSTSTNGAGWAGNVVFTGDTTSVLEIETIEATRKSGLTLTLNGEISGNGKIRLKSYGNIGRLCLAYPTNTFTGGIEFGDGALIPLHPESLSDWSKIAYETTSTAFSVSDGDGFEIPLDAEGTSGWTYEKAMEFANLVGITSPFNSYPRFSSLVYGDIAPKALVYSDATPLASGKYVGSKTDTPVCVTNDVAVNLQWRTGTAVLTGPHPILLKAAYTIDSPWLNYFPWDAEIRMSDAFVTNAADSYVRIGNVYGGQVTVSNAVWTSANPRGYDYKSTEGDIGANTFRHDSICLGSGTYGYASGGILNVRTGAVVSNRLNVGSFGYSPGFGSVFQTGGRVVPSGGDGTYYGAVALGFCNGGHGYYELRDGLLETHGAMSIGYLGTGVFHQYGGTVEVCKTFGDRNAGLAIDGGNGGEGTLYIAGGTFRVASGSPQLNNSYTGVTKSKSSLNVCGPTAVFEASGSVSAGTASVGGQTALVNVADGGTLAVPSFVPYQCKNSNRIYVNFDGGTFRTKSNDVDVFRRWETPVDAVTVYAGGMTVDTDGKTGAKTVVPLAGATGKGVASIAFGEPLGKYSWKESNGNTQVATVIGAAYVTIDGDGYGACAVAKYDVATKAVTDVVVTSPGVGYSTATCRVWFARHEVRTLTSDAGEVVLADNANTGSFTKKGDGDFTLGATNTWGGATVVAGGTLKAGCDWALPTNTAVTVSGGAVLDLNGKAAKIASVAYGPGGGTILRAAAAEVPAPTRLALSFDDILAGRAIALAGDVDMSSVTLAVSGAVPALDPKTCRKYRVVTVTGGSCSGRPTIEFDGTLPRPWQFLTGGSGVSLVAPNGLALIFQ